MESEPDRRAGLASKTMGSRKTDWASIAPLSAMKYDYDGQSEHIRNTYPYYCIMENIKIWTDEFSKTLNKVRELTGDWCWVSNSDTLIILFRNEHDAVVFKLSI